MNTSGQSSEGKQWEFFDKMDVLFGERPNAKVRFELFFYSNISFGIKHNLKLITGNGR